MEQQIEKMKNYINIEGVVYNEPSILINKYGKFKNFILEHKTPKGNFTISCSYLVGDEDVDFKKGDTVEITGKVSIKKKLILDEVNKHFIQVKVRTIKIV